LCPLTVPESRSVLLATVSRDLPWPERWTRWARSCLVPSCDSPAILLRAECEEVTTSSPSARSIIPSRIARIVQGFRLRIYKKLAKRDGEATASRPTPDRLLKEMYN